MTDELKIYDLRVRTYPNQRGDAFRSLQVFECWVCRALTNRVVMGGYPGYGVRTICPHSSECWHHEIEIKIAWAQKPHPKSYLKDLQEEIEAMRKAHATEAKNDIEGTPDFDQKRGVTNVRSYSPGSGCSHGI